MGEARVRGQAVIDNDLARVAANMQELATPFGTTVTTPAVRHHLAAGGKRFRARLALDAGLRLDLGRDVRVALATACELLHNASLVHDDVQDGDPRRRGQPAVWSDYGAGAAICVGDLLLSAAYAALSPLGPLAGELLGVVHGRVATVINGQAGDLRSATGEVDVATYREIAAAKSGGLLALPLELPLLASGQRAALARAGDAARDFAIGYQIADDVADAGADRALGQLNIVALLGAAGEDDPAARAADHAREHFDAAIQAAQTLPQGSGTLLGEQARELRRQVSTATGAVVA